MFAYVRQSDFAALCLRTRLRTRLRLRSKLRLQLKHKSRLRLIRNGFFCVLLSFWLQLCSVSEALAQAPAQAFARTLAKASEQAPMRIAAASDLQFVLPELLTTFQAVYSKSSEMSIEAVYGSSGNLAAQIRAGAPFDIFLSADTSYPNVLHRAGLTTAPPQIYACGRLVFWFVGDAVFLKALANARINAPTNTPTNADTLQALVNACASANTNLKADSRSVIRLALPNPAHAPYGRAAREVLQSLRVWDGLQSSRSTKIILADNAAQAAQMAALGTVEAAFLPMSLVLARSSPLHTLSGKFTGRPPGKSSGRYVLVGEPNLCNSVLHLPILHSAVVVGSQQSQQRSGQRDRQASVATALLRFLQTPEASRILARSGFAATSEK